jgi:hypothetical protein
MASYQIRVDYPLYLGKSRGRGAGCRGEKIPQLEKGIIKADLVLVIFSCGVGVPPAQKFDEKECEQEVEV